LSISHPKTGGRNVFSWGAIDGSERARTISIKAHPDALHSHKRIKDIRKFPEKLCAGMALSLSGSSFGANALYTRVSS
jgi:hypothetical protein